jgi:hypothetical protein
MDKHTVIHQNEPNLKPAYNLLNHLASHATNSQRAAHSIQSSLDYIKHITEAKKSPLQLAQCELNGHYLDQIKARLKQSTIPAAQALPGSKLAGLSA